MVRGMSGRRLLIFLEISTISGMRLCEARNIQWFSSPPARSRGEPEQAQRANGATPDRAALVESYVRHSVVQLERHRVLLLELKRIGMYLDLLGFATSTDGSAPRLPGNVDSGDLGDLLGGLHDGDAGLVDVGLREQFVAGALAQSVMWWLEDDHGIDQESFIKQTAQLILQAVG